jgi:hypothetical protein
LKYLRALEWRCDLDAILEGTVGRSLRAAIARRRNCADFIPGIKRFLNPHIYPVGLSPLHALRSRLIAEARGLRGDIKLAQIFA